MSEVFDIVGDIHGEADALRRLRRGSMKESIGSFATQGKTMRHGWTGFGRFLCSLKRLLSGLYMPVVWS
jgi:hypothetical protein